MGLAMLWRAAVAGLLPRLAAASAALADPARAAVAAPIPPGCVSEAKLPKLPRLPAKLPNWCGKEADKLAWSCSRDGVESAAPEALGAEASEGAGADKGALPVAEGLKLEKRC